MRPYLVAFIRECSSLPDIEDFQPHLTSMGHIGVIWCESPIVLFASKQKFMLAMCKLYQVLLPGYTVLPVQSGLRVGCEEDLNTLLVKYQDEIDSCFQLIQGCWEYDLRILVNLQDFRREKNTIPEVIQSGQEYLNNLRIKLKEQNYLKELATNTLNGILNSVSPWYRDHHAVLNGQTLEIAFLAPCKEERQFIDKLSAYRREAGVNFQWTGPWPPFNFSSFSFKSEKYLTHELLTWEGRERI